MISFASLVFAASSTASILSLAAANPAKSLGALTLPGTIPGEENNGFYYNWSTDNPDHSIYTNGAAGQYSLIWFGSNSTFIGGKGWNPGAARTIHYTGLYKPNGNSFLGVHGWTRNPLIEYFIVESYGYLTPAAAASKKGTVTCDGATYDILVATQVNAPSINGIATFQQYWSVRSPRKTPGGAINGTVTTGCHFNAWAAMSMYLGAHNYQILATQGSFSSGSSIIVVS